MKPIPRRNLSICEFMMLRKVAANEFLMRALVCVVSMLRDVAQLHGA